MKNGSGGKCRNKRLPGREQSIRKLKIHRKLSYSGRCKGVYEECRNHKKEERGVLMEAAMISQGGRAWLVMSFILTKRG